MTPPIDQLPSIRSTLADDEDMAELLAEFIERLPARVSRILALLEQRDLAGLQQAVHQLKGAGGGYGFQAITDLAAGAERAIKQGEALETIQQQVDDLIVLIRRVGGYNAGLE